MTPGITCDSYLVTVTVGGNDSSYRGTQGLAFRVY